LGQPCCPELPNGPPLLAYCSASLTSCQAPTLAWSRISASGELADSAVYRAARAHAKVRRDALAISASKPLLRRSSIATLSLCRVSAPRRANVANALRIVPSSAR